MVSLEVGREPGVVAVSGGADSVALLRALIAVRTGPLTVAHFNHHLRGAESDADAAFVQELAARFGLTFRLGGANVAKLAAEAGDNLEATARRLRYGWLVEVAVSVGARWIATGHTADDQAETVLHRLIRGTGIQGLRGIASKSRGQRTEDRGQERHAGADLSSVLCPLSSGFLVRPFLSVTRADVLELLAKLDLPHREDATNADPRFTRNRIRHEVLPLLRTFNPEIVAVLGRLADQAGEAFDVLEADADRLLAKAELPPAGESLILDAVTLVAAHPYHVREAFRLLWHREGWHTNGMTADHWSRLVRIARGEVPAADFPGGVSVRHAGRVVQFSRRS